MTAIARPGAPACAADAAGPRRVAVGAGLACRLARPLRCSAFSQSFALFDLLPGMPGVAHAVVLALFAARVCGGGGMGRARRRGVGGWPERSRRGAASSRSSGLPHRPLQALGRLPERAARRQTPALWAAHQRRMAAALRRLRVGWPAAGLARRDPWGIRSVLAILLLLAVIDAGADWRDRALPRLPAELRRFRRVAGDQLRVYG